MTDFLTPYLAFSLYEDAFKDGRLVQSDWHSTDEDGRQLACALGVLGTGINSPRDCPANVMPRWLAQMVPWFFDNQNFEEAKEWGLTFYEQIKRLNGNVPFSVIHDWQANVVGAIAIEGAEKRNTDAAVHRALAEMQFKALTGQKFSADDWRPVLKAAFLDIYKFRYRADAYANAYANANADAYAYANADAYAYANADAYAYANAYANAYADAYADAYANANAYAYAYADAYANAYAYKAAIKRLADGMVEALSRVEA